MKRDKRDLRINTRITRNEWAELLLICDETGVSSPYKIMQVLVKWFLGWHREMNPTEQSAIEDSIRAEVQEEFDTLAETLDPRGKHFTSDRRQR